MSPENIATMVEASLDSEIEQTSIAMIIGDTNPKYDAETMIEILKERLGTHPNDFSDQLTILEDTVSPLGRGAQLDVAGLTPRNAIDSGCTDTISTISLHPDGSIKACCGHAQWYVPDLTLGNIEDESLTNIVERSQQNVLYWLIHNVGPKQLLERLDVDGNYSGICHACHDLLGNHREELLDYIEANKEEIVREDIFLSDNIERDAQQLVENKEAVLDRIEHMINA